MLKNLVKATSVGIWHTTCISHAATDSRKNSGVKIHQQSSLSLSEEQRTRTAHPCSQASQTQVWASAALRLQKHLYNPSRGVVSWSQVVPATSRLSGSQLPLTILWALEDLNSDLLCLNQNSLPNGNLLGLRSPVLHNLLRDPGINVVITGVWLIDYERGEGAGEKGRERKKSVFEWHVLSNIQWYWKCFV